MKLRNKKTGDIGELTYFDSRMYILIDNELRTDLNYNSLSELNKEWEDYEEPKEWWFIDCSGFIKHGEGLFTEKSYIKDIQAIGNYFETKEEAEKAVKKLKAWKRLKDKGFKFIGVRGIGKVIDFDIPEPYNHVGFDEYDASKDEKEFYDDLLFLFGGE